ncbi:MAG: EamA family transporter [Chloroflexota bacterium]
MSIRDIGLAVLIAAIWGFNFVVIKLGLGEFPPLFFAMLRFIFVAIPAVFFVDRKQIPWKWIISIGIAIGVVKFGLLYIGMDLGLPTGLASLVLQAQVVFTVILGVMVFKEKIDRGQLLGIAIAVVGMALIGSNKIGGSQFIPFVMVVGAGLAWAIGNLLIKHSKISDGFRLFIWMGLVPPTPLLILSLLTEQGQLEALINLNLLGIGSVLYTSMISTVVGFGLWGWLISKYSASSVAPFALLVPIFGLYSAALFLGDSLTTNEQIGGLIVLAGLGLIIFSGRIAKTLGYGAAPIPKN